MRTPEERQKEIEKLGINLPPCQEKGLLAEVVKTFTSCVPEGTIADGIGIKLYFPNLKRTLTVLIDPESAARIEWQVKKGRETDPLIFP